MDSTEILYTDKQLDKIIKKATLISGMRIDGAGYTIIPNSSCTLLIIYNDTTHLLTDYYHNNIEILKQYNGNLSVIGGRNFRNASMLFADLRYREIDISRLNISMLTSASTMFLNCRAEIKFGKLNTVKLRNARNIFTGYRGEYLNLSTLDTTSLVDMSGMFVNARIDTLDLSNIQLRPRVKMNKMFNLANIKHIITDNKIILSEYENRVKP